ncbi:MAG: hypothetical protein M1827_000452 [Pycnora praestabilis]|nr:MAG: hypothetical protein M1827_000452 [Pycnora praestabilis]
MDLSGQLKKNLTEQIRLIHRFIASNDALREENKTLRKENTSLKNVKKWQQDIAKDLQSVADPVFASAEEYPAVSREARLAMNTTHALLPITHPSPISLPSPSNQDQASPAKALRDPPEGIAVGGVGKKKRRRRGGRNRNHHRQVPPYQEGSKEKEDLEKEPVAVAVGRERPARRQDMNPITAVGRWQDQGKGQEQGEGEEEVEGEAEDREEEGRVDEGGDRWIGGEGQVSSFW